MKPASFLYTRASTADEAVAALVEHGDEAKLLAGGQSLIPMLNFRLARPGVLVDISRVEEFRRIDLDGDVLVIGAAVPQAVAERSPVVSAACPLMQQALRHVGHPQIRARGTVGGSIAHADASAELAALVLALDAELVVHGPEGTRTIPAAGFFLGPWMSTVAAEEVLVEVRVPVFPELRTTFLELARRSGDFAVVGLAAGITVGADDRIAEARLAAIGVGIKAQRLVAAEAALVGAAPSPEVFAEAGDAAAAEVNPPSEKLKGDATYRRGVLTTLVQRALTEVAA